MASNHWAAPAHSKCGGPNWNFYLQGNKRKDQPTSKRTLQERERPRDSSDINLSKTFHCCLWAELKLMLHGLLPKYQ